MSNDYFERLIALARKLDAGIEELEDAWQFPGILVGGYADITEETEARIESLKSSIQQTQDGVNELIRAKETPDLEVDELIKKAQRMYDYLKEDVDNLEIVFKEFGYHNDKDSVDNSEGINETEISSNSNLDEQEDSMEEIIFTPDLSWRCKKKSIDKASLNGSGHLPEKIAILNEIESRKSEKAQQINSINYTKESMYTPTSSIQLKSTMLNKIAAKDSGTHKQFFTPLRERPQSSIYSKHFYSAIKKDCRQ